MRRRESERVRRKRAQIREGAVEVFLVSGFVGSSMDQVASTAQVSKQTLYTYYRSKEELLIDVMSTLLDGLQERVPDLWDRKVTTREELRENLVDVAVNLTAVIMREDYLALVRVILGELSAVPDLIELWRRTVPAQLLELVGDLLRRSQDAGVVRDVDIELATRMFVGPVMSYVLLDGITRPDNVVVPEPSRLESLVDLYLGVVTEEPVPGPRADSSKTDDHPRRARKTEDEAATGGGNGEADNAASGDAGVAAARRRSRKRL